MNIRLNTDLFAKYGLTDAEVWYLIGKMSNFSTEDTIKSLLAKGLITQNGLLFCEITVTRKASEMLQKLILDSEPNAQKTEDRCTNLAIKLQQTFPEGSKMKGHPWRCNTKEIAVRLQKFFKRYGQIYTDEQIVNAAEKYVKSFNGDYTYMRTLKYFILKTISVGNEDGTNHNEEVSDLASYIENTEENVSQDWNVELR